MTDPIDSRPPLVIDIVSDVVCPWCYVGKRRLEAALAERADDTITVRWHPFQLDPTIPVGGLDRHDYMVKKFGSAERIDEIHGRLTEAGRGEGLEFAFDRITRSVNTLDAHRVLHWAAAAGVQDAVAEALFRAYFVDGRDIGSPVVLADLAASAGLNGAEVAEALAGSRDIDLIQAEIAQAVRIGVSGVPFFIFAQSFAVSGAQAADVLATAIDRARAELASPAPITA
ncbi:DsbA family oxidoreductase [Lichenihabitans psoromatis]|uniref:DsbA family oxidoreductase n=1 Tax=Lichenihabitans psoromatis TaxID=2528642 RepID=UPI0010382D89|nr:DsbA family oxidoreductase [Lichenihabitans psoromatis]